METVISTNYLSTIDQWSNEIHTIKTFKQSKSKPGEIKVIAYS